MIEKETYSFIDSSDRFSSCNFLQRGINIEHQKNRPNFCRCCNLYNWRFFLVSVAFQNQTMQTPSSTNTNVLTNAEGSSVFTKAVVSSQRAPSTEENYWLHKSNLKLPEQNACKRAQKMALEGLSDLQIKEVQNRVREEHMQIEYYLVKHVKTLKSSSSPYWAYFERTGTISIPGDETVWNEWDKDTIIEDLKGINSTIKNETMKSDFMQMEDTLQTAVKQHNLRKVFLYHEMIHDCDYWVINYPAYFSKSRPADWSGIKTYFSQSSLLAHTNENAISAVH